MLKSISDVWGVILRPPSSPRSSPCQVRVLLTPSTRHIVFHDQNAAELSICDGSLAHPPSSSSQPPTPRCRGNPVLTTGRSGTALFTVAALTKGATVNVDRDSWEQCVRAARAVCPTGSMTGTCWGGATQGNIGFTLDLAGFWNE